jgi:hypothetical protein
VGDFDGSSPLRAAPRQLSKRKLDLTRQNARSCLKRGFVTRKGTKSASQTLNLLHAPGAKLKLSGEIEKLPPKTNSFFGLG